MILNSLLAIYKLEKLFFNLSYLLNQIINNKIGNKSVQKIIFYMNILSLEYFDIDLYNV